MSNNEVGKLRGTIYSMALTNALVAGAVPANTYCGGADRPMTPQSRILGVTSSNNPAPAPGTSYNYSISLGIGAIAQTAAGQVVITGNSSVNTDTSVLTLYWYNESAPGLLLA